MKNHRIVAAGCVMLSIVLMAIVSIMISARQGSAGLATGAPVFGNTELALSAGTAASSSVLNLASSATTAGSSSTPCKSLMISPTISYTGSGTVSLYMGSGTATCTYLVMTGGSSQFNSATGALTLTAGTASSTYRLPGNVYPSVSVPATNTNQLFFKLTNSGSDSTATANVEAAYQQ